MVYYKYVLLLYLTVQFFSIKGQKLPNVDGTYISVSPKNIKDTNYVRIKFLNDSIFAFTLAESPFLHDKNRGISLDFNYGVFSGIGGSFLVNGNRYFVGAIVEDNNFFNNQDKEYYTTDSILSIQQAIDSIPPPYYPYNQYVLIKFLFDNENDLRLNIIKKPAGRFKISESYKKIDSKKLFYGINSDFNYNFHNHSYDESTVIPVLVKKTTDLMLLPLPARVFASNFKIKIKAGAKLFLSTIPGSYMKYAFVYQIDENHHYTNYGWIDRSFIKPILQK